MSARRAFFAAVAAVLAAKSTGDCDTDDISLSNRLKKGSDECSRLCSQDPYCGQFRIDGSQLCCGNSGKGKTGYTQLQGPKGCNDVGQCVVCATNTFVDELEKSKSDQTEVLLSSECDFASKCTASEEIDVSYNFKSARLVTVTGNDCVFKGRIKSSSDLYIPENLKMKSPEDGVGSAIFFDGKSFVSSKTLKTMGYLASIVSAKATDTNITINDIEPKNLYGNDLEAPYALGLAHVTGHIHVESCGSGGIAVIQEIEGDILDADIVCNKIINLTDALQLFGLAFEIRFFNGGVDEYNYADQFFLLEIAGIACGVLLACIIIVHADTLYAIFKILKPSHASKLKAL